MGHVLVWCWKVGKIVDGYGLVAAAVGVGLESWSMLGCRCSVVVPWDVLKTSWKLGFLHKIWVYRVVSF